MILGIYGASGLGREVLELAKVINNKENRWDDFIFIDDGNVPDVVNDCPVYRYDAAKEKYGSDLEITMGIGEPATREKLFKKVTEDGFDTPTLIHPDVHIPKSTSVGKGVTIQYGCFISCNACIKDFVFIQPQCNVGHDDVLDEGCMLSGFSNLGGLVHIGNWSYIGLSAAIKQCAIIGNYSIVGMGSIVHKDIPDNMIAMGNPARPISRNDDKTVFKR